MHLLGGALHGEASHSERASEASVGVVRPQAKVDVEFTLTSGVWDNAAATTQFACLGPVKHGLLLKHSVRTETHRGSNLLAANLDHRIVDLGVLVVDSATMDCLASLPDVSRGPRRTQLLHDGVVLWVDLVRVVLGLRLVICLHIDVEHSIARSFSRLIVDLLRGQ